MKYILTLLLLATSAQAESFNIPITADIYGRGAHSTTFSGARNATTTSPTGTTNTTADTLICAVGYTSPSYKVWRIRILSDSINGLGGHSSYLDSMEVDPGYTARLDSLRLWMIAKNAVDLGGCTGYLHCYIFDTVATLKNYIPGSFATQSLWNDIWTPDYTNFCDSRFMDSALVDTNTMGMGKSDTMTFTLTNRTILNEIQALMEVPFTAGSPQCLRFDIVTCYDKDSTNWGTADPYQFKVSFASTEHATAELRPTLTGYWTAVPPADNSLPWFSSNPFMQLPFGTKPFSH